MPCKDLDDTSTVHLTTGPRVTPELHSVPAGLDHDALHTVDGQELRAMMGYFPTGVTVVSSHANGTDQGMTANSVTSVSLNPPLIAVCTSHGSRTQHAIDASGGFAVTFLSGDQEQLALHFARAHKDHFRDITIGRTGLGHPYLPEGIGFLECVVLKKVEAGDHSVLIGKVTECALSGGDPLVFFRSELGNLPQQTGAWSSTQSKERK